MEFENILKLSIFYYFIKLSICNFFEETFVQSHGSDNIYKTIIHIPTFSSVNYFSVSNSSL